MSGNTIFINPLCFIVCIALLCLLNGSTHDLPPQGRALLKLPNKKERSAVEAAEAALEVERKEARAREARHKLTVERLRRQIVELQASDTLTH